jgi:hypothetical protein
MATASLFDQVNHLTPAEKLYILRHPHHALTIKDSKETAYAETRRRFGRNGHNDQSDAFRHCFWSALLARELGKANALEFTTAHESSPSNDPAEKAMDLYNNRIGLDIGRSGGTDQSLSVMCFAALNSGRLKVLEK